MTIERHMQSGNMFMWPIEMLTFPFNIRKDYTGIKNYCRSYNINNIVKK